MPAPMMNEIARGARGRGGAFLLLVIALGACGVSKKEIAEARSSVYDADFAVVYSAVVASVRELYPNYDDDPQSGVIKTAWHQVKYSDPGADDPKSVQARDQTLGVGTASPTNSTLGYSPSLANRINFIRFDVAVDGGRPYHIRVHGTAAQLEPGNALPTPMKEADAPHWLAGRTDALIVAIHRKLKPYAKHVDVVMPDHADGDDEPVVSVNGDIPTGARDAAVGVVASLRKRDYDTFRKFLADDVVWSLGAAGGADTAMAMWQADPATFDAMDKAISAGCARDGADVVCPATPAPGAWSLRLAQRGSAWRVVSFVQGE